MVTISLCMIVKNEEAVLSRCLDSIADFMDEIIILDTGSTDRTKEIAARYTDKVYDYAWTGDFSAARNASFEKATMEYIYCADADEVLEGENQEKFRQLKEVLLPEIEMVQMYYETITEGEQLYNFKREYRPKLFKRIRTFTWIDAIHETVRLEPVVYDSDIVIAHRPQGNHGARDIAALYQLTEKESFLSPKLHHMYAMELLHMGSEEELQQAVGYFSGVQQEETGDLSFEKKEEMARESACVLAKAFRLQGNLHGFFTQCMKETAGGNPCSEICFQLGEYYFGAEEYQEAVMWFYNAAYETESILDVHAGGDKALERLAECYGLMGNIEEEKRVRQEVKIWEMPQDM